MVPLGVTFTRVTAIFRAWGLCAAVSARQLTEQFSSICVAACRASSWASSHSPCLICEDTTRCDAGGPAAKSRNALLIPRWRDRDSHGPPARHQPLGAECHLRTRRSGSERSESEKRWPEGATSGEPARGATFEPAPRNADLEGRVGGGIKSIL